MDKRQKEATVRLWNTKIQKKKEELAEAERANVRLYTAYSEANMQLNDAKRRTQKASDEVVANRSKVNAFRGQLAQLQQELQNKISDMHVSKGFDDASCDDSFGSYVE